MNKEIEYLKKYLKDKDMETAIKELESGIPVQYIVGNVDFYGNTFKVNKNTLIPRFETELLVEKTIKYINKYFNNEIKILDIGTGSGCIAITLNKLLDNSGVTAVDISKDALDVARENNKINNTDVNFIESDVFSNINDKYDVIISNPPYISYDEDIMDVVYNNEPHMALYADDNGLYFYDKILRECRKYLNDRFLIAFEIGYKQGNDILNIINKYFDTYPGVRDYMDKEIETAKKNGYVKTIMNRKRVIDELKSTNYMIRNMGERMALNTPVQGSASDILKKAMIEIDEIFEKENIKSKMLLQVHDELIFNVYDDEIDKVKEIVYNTMTNVFDLKVPLDVDIELGNNWYEAK